MSSFDKNAVEVTRLLDIEFLVPCISSFITLTLIYLLTLYILIPKFVNPKFPHIAENEKLQYKIATAVTSFINGIGMGFVSLIWLHDNFTMTVTKESCIEEGSSPLRIWFAIGTGYYLYDIVIYCILGELKHSGKVDYIYLIHHLIGISIFVWSLLAIYGGNIAIIVFWFHEWTIPLLYTILFTNYFTVNRKKYRTILVDFTLKILYFVAFIGLRFGFGGKFAIQLLVMYHEESPVYLQVSAGLMTALNGLMSIVMLLHLRKVFGKLRKEKVEQVVDINTDTMKGEEETTKDDTVKAEVKV